MLNKIYQGDALEVMRQWPAECVDMCVTSPPYWNLRDYGVDGQLGQEKMPEEYIEKLVAVFREVRRVLRPWGTVWLNMGDSHASGKGSCHNPGDTKGSLEAKRIGVGAYPLHRGNISDLRRSGLKPQDLCGIPTRLVEALQADGWHRRSDIIWQKTNSMRESMEGWLWEQHQVKVDGVYKPAKQDRHRGSDALPGRGRHGTGTPEWKDCPGCPKCEKNDGLVLCKGSGRPTRIYEYIFLLAKSAKYFYDTEAVRTISGANLCNVWTITTQAYPDAHYATFPEELPRRCILAGTSAKGNCAECGMPWVRIVESKSHYEKREPAHAPNSEPSKVDSSGWNPPTKTYRGWHPSCICKADTVPALVLDPFFGSGTVGKVATDLGRNWVGIEINEEYIKKQAWLRAGGATSEEIVAERPLFGVK